VTISGKVLTDVVAISAGVNHCLALKSDGTVVAWGGENQFGERTVPAGLTNVMAISAGGNFSLALKKDGNVVVWGDESKYSPPDGLSNIVAISAGDVYGLALKNDGAVIRWPSVTKLAGATNIIAIISTGMYRSWHILALKNDGSVSEWGLNGNLPAGLSNVIAIAAGATHSLALKQNGTVFGWGDNLWGEATGNTFSRISSGLVTIGGQVLTDIVAVAANASSSLPPNGHSLALKKDGTVITWGYSPDHTLDVPVGLSNVIAIAAGDNFCLAITTNRAVAEKFRH
jgi:alpha-tubulin suppressor-like RCC1 family protein